MGYDDFYSVKDVKYRLIDAIIQGYLSLSDYEKTLSEQDIEYIKKKIKEKKNE